MLDANDLLNVIKKAAIDAVETSKPTTWMIGTVISTSPLKINVDQKMTLTKEQLVLTRNVTDYEINETVEHLTEKRAGGSSYAQYEAHDHEYKGTKKFLIHHALAVGDEVVLIRIQGGQRFLIVDRVVKA